jgi:hypothetical protein
MLIKQNASAHWCSSQLLLLERKYGPSCSLPSAVRAQTLPQLQRMLYPQSPSLLRWPYPMTDQPFCQGQPWMFWRALLVSFYLFMIPWVRNFVRPQLGSSASHTWSHSAVFGWWLGGDLEPEAIIRVHAHVCHLSAPPNDFFLTIWSAWTASEHCNIGIIRFLTWWLTALQVVEAEAIDLGAGCSDTYL